MNKIKYKIVGDVPVPNKRGNIKYPFMDMKVGNSLVVETSGQVVLTAAKLFAIRYNLEWKFITRKEGNKTRIWRIS